MYYQGVYCWIKACVYYLSCGYRPFMTNQMIGCSKYFLRWSIQLIFWSINSIIRFCSYFKTVIQNNSMNVIYTYTIICDQDIVVSSWEALRCWRSQVKWCAFHRVVENSQRKSSNCIVDSWMWFLVQFILKIYCWRHDTV